MTVSAAATNNVAFKMTEDSSVNECVDAFMLWVGVRRGPLINS